MVVVVSLRSGLSSRGTNCAFRPLTTPRTCILVEVLMKPQILKDAFQNFWDRTVRLMGAG